MNIALFSQPPYARQARKAFRDFKQRVEADGGVIETPNETRQELKRLARLGILDKFSLYWDFVGGSLGKLQTIVPTGEDLFATVERSSQKSIFNRDGIIEQIDANQPPLTFNKERGMWGILPEGQSQNLLSNSNASTYLVGTNLVKENTTIVGQPGVKVTVTSGVGAASTQSQRVNPPAISIPINVGEKITMSWIVRKDGNSNLVSVWLFSSSHRLQTSQQDITSNTANFLFTTGFINTFFKSEKLKDNVYKISFGGESIANDTLVSYNIAPYTTNDAMSFCAPQLETGSTATSYIPTTDTAQTRNPDNISITAPDKIGQQEGFVYAEVDISSLSKPNVDIFNLSDGTLNNRVLINLNDTGIRTVIRGSLGNTFIRNSGSIITGNQKFILKYSNTTFKLFRNGLLLDELSFTTGDLVLSHIHFGSRAGGTNHFNDTIYRIGIGKEALTDEEAIKLTL